MIYKIEDFMESDFFYFPLQFDLIKEMYVLYDHDVALTAIVLASRWFENNEDAIDIEQAAISIAKRQNMEVNKIRSELDMAFKRIIRSVIPLAKKRQLSKKRREAGIKGNKKRWEKNN